MSIASGTLYLIPCLLHEDASLQSMSPQIKAVLDETTEYIVENEKSARKFLKMMEIKTPQNALIIHEYAKHSRKEEIPSMMKSLLEGKNIGLLSEAGCPAVADPGADMVSYAHEKNIRVVPLTGPSSIILGLMASGFSGQSFAFNGYLPIDRKDRISRIKEMEKQSERFGQTQIFIETPFRNNHLLEDLIKTCQDATRICICVDLTSAQETIVSKPVRLWKKETYDFHKRPAIFLLFRG